MARLKTWQLFAICVLVWGTTWHAITYQLAADFPAEAGVALRFALAGAGLLAFCRWRGVPLRYPPGENAALALQGAFLYGVSYVCVYHAERFVPSGLVAVGYSASPLLAGLGAALLFGTPIGLRFVAGGMLGLVGVAVIFWPEIARPSRGGAAIGAVLTVLSVLLSAIGSLAASRNRRRGVPLLAAMGYGMLYGALCAALVAIAIGRGGSLPTAPSWWLSFLYLAGAGSVLAFASFLTLQDRIGPGAAGSVGVMTPLLALLVSIAFEGFRPDLLTAVGAALAVAGNALMLTPARTDLRAAPAAAREAG